MFIGFSAAKHFYTHSMLHGLCQETNKYLYACIQNHTNWTHADVQMNERTMKITSNNRRGLFEIYIGNIKNEFYDEISVFLAFDISLQVGLSLTNLAM